MSAQSGAATVVSCSTTSGGTYDEIVGIKDATTDTGIDALDTTAFSDTTGSGSARTFLAGLRTFTLSFSGRFERTDTGYAKVLAAVMGTYANLFFKILPDGTNGYRFEGIVTSHSVSSAVDNFVEVTFDVQVTGAAVAVP